MTPSKGTIKGTGTDPLGRYAEGAVITDLSGAPLKEALAQGWVTQAGDTDLIGETKAAIQATVHTPTREGRGVVRTDRAFTDDEAAAIDAANRRAHAERRIRRFHGDR